MDKQNRTETEYISKAAKNKQNQEEAKKEEEKRVVKKEFVVKAVKESQKRGRAQKPEIGYRILFRL